MLEEEVERLEAGVKVEVEMGVKVKLDEDGVHVLGVFVTKSFVHVVVLSPCSGEVMSLFSSVVGDQFSSPTLQSSLS